MNDPRNPPTASLPKPPPAFNQDRKADSTPTKASPPPSTGERNDVPGSDGTSPWLVFGVPAGALFVGLILGGAIASAIANGKSARARVIAAIEADDLIAQERVAAKKALHSAVATARADAETAAATQIAMLEKKAKEDLEIAVAKARSELASAKTEPQRDSQELKPSDVGVPKPSEIGDTPMPQVSGDVKPPVTPNTTRVRPSSLDQDGRPTLQFFPIALADKGEWAIEMARPVKQLSLIGGNDSTSFSFTENAINKPGELGIVETKKVHGLVGTFRFKERSVIFRWEAGDKPDTDPQKMRKDFLDCVLKVQFDNGNFEYFWLQDPVMKTLPAPLWDWRDQPRPKKGSSTKKGYLDGPLVFTVPLCGTDSARKTLWTNHKLTLNKLVVTPDKGERTEFRTASKGNGLEYTVLVEESLFLASEIRRVSVVQAGITKDDLRFIVSPKPLSEEDLEQINRFSLFAEPLQWDEKVTRERAWTKSVDSILSGRFEASLSVKIGDQEFALPLVTSENKPEATDQSKGERQ